MQTHLEIPGSTKFRDAQATWLAPLDANQPVRVSLLLRRRDPDHDLRAKIKADPHRFTREEFRTSLGADPNELEAVSRTLAAFQLKEESRDQARRTIWLTGSASAVSRAFKVALTSWQLPDGPTYRSHDGPVYIPREIAPFVLAVFGLDNRPLLHPHVKTTRSAIAGSPRVSNTLNPVDVTRLYQFPPGTSGSGQTIGILEFGGGFLQSDINAFFNGLGIKAPNVLSVSVDSAVNSPAGGFTATDAEVALDIQIAGGCAPGATLVVYFAPNSESGFADAITAAVNDSTNNPSVISISWGLAEDRHSSMGISAIDSAISDAALMGVTICAASGDSGASDLTLGDGLAHVDFPASSPNVLACGGTELQTGSNALESVWNSNGFASGGGISATFPVPFYQVGLSLPASVNPGAGVGRGVPDVAGNAAPETGYNIIVHGNSETVGGTSAVAPMWAALIARLNEELKGQLGFFNPRLYKLQGNACFTDVTVGNNDVGNDNGGYNASAGWDCCTGLGTPIGIRLLHHLQASKLSQFFPPNQITSGYQQEGQIYIDTPYTNDLSVRLNSDDPNTLSVPAFRTIPGGSLSTSVTFTAAAISGPFVPKFVKVHATYAGTTLAVTVTVVPPRLVSIVLTPNVVTSGHSVQCTITLDRPSVLGAVQVELFNSAPAFATVPASVTIDQDHLSKTFTINAPTIGTTFRTAHVTLLAVYRASSSDPGSSASAVLTVRPTVVVGVLKSFVLNPAEISQGGHSYGIVSLEQPVPMPTTVTLAALDSALPLPGTGNNSNIVTIPPSVTIPANDIQGQFTITATTSSIHGSKRHATIMAGAIVTRSATLTIDF